MSARAVRRVEDVGIARGFAQSVYAGRRLLGYVHRLPKGFAAETEEGEHLGFHRTSAAAAHAIALNAQVRT
jgi:hypothetical protein